jgi:glycosyltransferase involved in cell wall biosynthesis
MPDPSTPVISVLMAVFNTEKYLAQAVHSILMQTHREFEFIIVNDGSTDGSLAILRQYAARDDRIRLLSRGNTGVARALNDGLACARGEFVARMDSDDISLPRRLELQLAFMRQHPECVAISCQEVTIDPEGWPVRLLPCPLSHDEIDSLHLKGYGGALSGPSAFLRREAVMAVGGYRGEYTVAEDYDLFLRLAEVGRLANLAEVLFCYREHPSGLTQSNRDRRRLLTWKAQKEAHERRRLRFDKPPPPPAEAPATDFRLRWATLALAAGYYGTARKHAWRQFVRAPARAPMRILVEATVRPVAEPLYDLVRGRLPRSYSGAGPAVPPAVVRGYTRANTPLV